MRRFIPFRLLSAAAAATAVALVAVVPASAHEVRTVGKYEFTVGWLHEPAYADEQNAVQFLLKDSAGNPIDAQTSQSAHAGADAAQQLLSLIHI